MNYSITGHADGPTAYFYAGKVGSAGSSGGFVFTWNWINLFGLLFIVLLLLPNIVYALKCRSGNHCENRLMNVLEQIGRYGSMLFMVVCLKSGGYGFSSVGAFLVYFFGSLALLISYWIVWGIYLHRIGTKRTGRENSAAAACAEEEREAKRIGALQMSLAVLPACLFLLDGITLGYVLLVISAMLFAVGHIYVTRQNVERKESDQHDIRM